MVLVGFVSVFDLGPLLVGSYHAPFSGTQLYGVRILTPKQGNQKKGYGMSLLVV